MYEISVYVYRNNYEIFRDQKYMEIRIDEVIILEEDIKSLGILVGDFVSFDLCIVIMLLGFIKFCYLDDKVSVVMIL